MTDDPRAAAFEKLLTDEVLDEFDEAMRTIWSSREGANVGRDGARAVIVRALLKSAPPAEGPTWQQVEAVLRDLEDRNGSWALTPSQVDAALFLMGKRPTPPRDPAGKE